MSPLHVLQLGKSLWDIYEEISERDESPSSDKRSNHRNTIDPELSSPWKWFDRGEFACPCCDKNRISSELVDRLDSARDKAGVPFKITSGYRCERRNRKVKGKIRSSHLEGFGADISCPSGAIKATVIAALFAVGIKRVGIYKTFVHCDISPKLSTPCIWT